MARLYLRKTDKKKLEENPRLPYFSLVLIPDDSEEGDEWPELGAFWKAKNGIGYSGKTKDGVVIKVPAVKPKEKPDPTEALDKAVDGEEHDEQD